MSELQAQRLAKLLSLQHAVQELTTVRDFGFFVVNETHQLVKYDTAALWEINPAGLAQIKGLSGIAQINTHSPLVQWLRKFVNFYYKQCASNPLLVINKEELVPELSADWPQGLPDHLLWCPFIRENLDVTGGLLFARSEPWEEKELQMLDWLIRSYTFCWYFLNHSQGFKSKLKRAFTYKRKIATGIFIALFALMFFPVTQTVLAPAEVIARDPIIVTAVMQGVIEKIHIKPNQPVASDQILFSMDKTDLLNSNQMEKKELHVTKSKYAKAVQKGFKEREARAEINILQAQVAEQKHAVEYSETLLNRADVSAKENGIAVFTSVNEWEGQPVATGEKIMMLALPNQVELEIWLPVADAIEFNPGDTIKLYSNADPLNPVTGKIMQTSYHAQLTPKQILAYRIVAEFNSKQELPRLGTQGTAKLYGGKVSLFYYLFRRPITVFRQTLGW